jgi:hypothetical protein
MEECIKVSKYCVGGHGPFEKWWYRAEVHGRDGNYGLGFGAGREAAVKRACKDLAKGGRNPVAYADKLGKDDTGRLTCVDGSGRKYLLRGERWVRSG